MTPQELLVGLEEATPNPIPGYMTDVDNALLDLLHGPVLTEEETQRLLASGRNALSGCLWWNHGPPTQSLDAAVALCRRLLPGCWYTVGNCRLEAHATLGHEVGAGPIDNIEGLAPSGQPALALCRAIVAAWMSLQARPA
jgi:hypothetical protein